MNPTREVLRLDKLLHQVDVNASTKMHVVKAPYNDALYTDNRVTMTKFPKTVGLHCKFPPYNSNDARYNDWPNVAV